MENKYFYEVVTNEIGYQVIKRISEDGSESWIPKDEENSDYQKYLTQSKDNNAN